MILQKHKRYSHTLAEESNVLNVGSMLGPTLFSMYVIPLGKILESLSRSYQKYADDTVSYFRIGNIHNNCKQIDEKMNRIIEWFA